MPDAGYEIEAIALTVDRLGSKSSGDRRDVQAVTAEALKVVDVLSELSEIGGS